MGLWVVVSTEEIDRLAWGYDVAVDELEAARLELLALGASADSGPGSYLPTALAAQASADEALVQCEVAITRMLTRAGALREAVRAYDGAESDSNLAFGPISVARSGPFAWVPPVGIALGSWLAGRPITGSMGADAATRFNFVALASVLSRTGLGRANDPVGSALSEITPFPPQPSPVAPAAASLVDLTDRIGVAYGESGQDDSAVEIQRIDHEDGTRSWVVAVPGTMGGLQFPSATDQPMSIDTNVSEYVGFTTAADALVISAMAAAGIRPGEKVLIAGHSLGGMVAVNLARDPALRDRFTFGGVVTFGSPVGHLPPAEGVPTLNVQNAEDPFPGLSGQVGARPAGPAEGEVVVVRELGSAAGPGVGSHNLETYSETAAEVDASESPGLMTWRAQTAELWAGEGDEVTATIYRGARAD